MKKLLTLVTLIAVAALPAKAQTSFFTDRAIQQVNQLGIPNPVLSSIPYASVRVCSLPLTQGSPCLPLASITDINGNPLSNSIGSNFGQTSTDATGRFTFGCTLGLNYQVQVAASASNTPAANYPITCPGVGSNPNFSSINKVIYVDQQAGATADVQLTNCNTALPNGGICDARGYGATTQSFAAQWVAKSGVTYLFDQNTVFQAASSSLSPVVVKVNARIDGLHFDCTNQAAYSGNIFTFNDNYRDGNKTALENYRITCSGVTTGTGVLLSSTGGSQAISFVTIRGGRVYGLLNANLLTASGNGFVNDNHFVDIQFDQSVNGWHFNNNNGQLNGNMCVPCSGEGSGLSNVNGVLFDGSTGVNDSAIRNVFQGQLNDYAGAGSAPILVSNTKANGNQFFGAWDGAPSDSSSSGNFYYSSTQSPKLSGGGVAIPNGLNVSGTGTFTGGFTATAAANNQAYYGALNGAAVVGSSNALAWKYPCTTAGVQSAISDAENLANGVTQNVVDASPCTTLTISSELDIGNHAGTLPIKFILPHVATWSVSITDGVSCGIKQFTLTTIKSDSFSGTSRMTLQPSSASTNIRALYCTDFAAGAGSYIRAEGFIATNTVGATMAEANDIENTVDGSRWDNIVGDNQSGISWLIHGVSGGGGFFQCVANGAFGAGAIPLKLLSDATFVNTDFTWYGGSIGHPGAGLNNILITSSSPPVAPTMDFWNVYFETNNTDTTTPMVATNSNFARLAFHNTVAVDLATSSTRNFFDIQNTFYRPQFIIDGFTSPSGTQVSGGKVFIDRTAVSNPASGVTDGHGSYGCYSSLPGPCNGNFSRSAPTLANGQNDNVALSATSNYLFITGPSAAYSISGFAGGYDGRILIVENSVTQPLTFLNNTGSTAGNRILTGNGANVVLPAQTGASAVFVYDSTNLIWNLIGISPQTGFTQTATAAGCTTAASIGGVCASPLTITWPVGFSDTNYKMSCSPNGAATNLPSTPYIVTKSAGSVTMNYFAITAAAASWPNVECTAVHN